MEMENKYNKFVNNAKKEVSVRLISGFWLWLILIIDGDKGRDLLDVLIQLLGGK